MLRSVTGCLLAACLFLSSAVNAEDQANWVSASDANAQLVLEIFAKFAPEGAGSLGVDGLDTEIMDLRPKVYERSLAATGEVIEILEQRLRDEKHPMIRQDLQILIKTGKDNLHTQRLEHDTLLPYHKVGQMVFQGIRALLDPQIPESRYPAAIERLKKYAGVVDGYKPLVELAKDRTRERFDVAGLHGPYRGEVEQDLERADKFVTGLKDLFAASSLEGWEGPYEKLAAQLGDYNDWIRAEMLPRAREDFRLPRELYENNLKNFGVDASPEALIQTASQGYMDIRNEMMALAPLVAKQKNYATTDYREVIRRLKDERIPGDKLLDFYFERLAKLEAIIVEHKLVSLPARKAGIRIGTAAETAAQPAAHLDIPRLIGNTGEYPEFILPLLEKNADGSWPASDDSYDAGTWTLTAHEARPGHELQFSSMLETGVSITRALFAFNSANVEGWALYAEAIAKPYMPLDGQMISLQYRLTRAARMFLDPMLNLGLIAPDEAHRILTEDVVLGKTWADTEIERYTYRMPGQATSYYYGYGKLQALRTQTEVALKDRFDQQAFHDFILAQGLLPPEILRDAVMTRFVAKFTTDKSVVSAD